MFDGSIFNDFAWSPQPNPYQHYTLLFVRLVVIEALTFVGISILCAFLYYIQAPQRRAVRVIRQLFGLVIIGHLLFNLSLFGVVGTWLVLAAVLDPTQFLPYGVAVLVVVVVGYTVGSQMLAAATRFKDRLLEAMEAIMQRKMRDALRKIETEAYANLMDERGHLASSVDVPMQASAKAEKKAAR